MKNLIKLIEESEGWRSKPYYCSENYPTVGFGFKIGDKDAPLPSFTLPRAAGEVWLVEILKELTFSLSSYHWFNSLNENRQNIILSMAYQMGVYGLLQFRNMIKAILEDNFQLAADEMLDSRWAKQTPERAIHHSTQFIIG